jgi:hypothetical protein
MTYDELLALARAATPEPWLEMLEANAQAIDEQAALLVGADRKMMMDYAFRIREAKDYIAACSPDAIISLIERARTAEAALTELIAALDNSVDPENGDDVAAMLRYAEAERTARAALGRKP